MPVKMSESDLNGLLKKKENQLLAQLEDLVNDMRQNTKEVAE